MGFLGALIAPLIAISVAASAQTPASRPGQLLFTRNGGLSLLGLDAGQPREVVARPEIGQVLNARWSPDGTRMAYAVYEVKNRSMPVSQVFVAAPDGTASRAVLGAEQPQTYYQTPVWGPGGTHLYAQHFAQGAERVRRTLRLNLATGQVDTVVEDLGPFDVSADGRWLALARTTAEGPTLSVIDLQGGETRVLVDARQFEVINSPRFDPASQQLLFAAAPLGRLPSMQPAALIPFQVLAASATRHGPPQDLFVVPVSGGPYHRVAELAADDPSAAWSPDGTQLAILSVEALRTTGLAGDSTRLLLEPGSYGSVDWTR